MSLRRFVLWIVGVIVSALASNAGLADESCISDLSSKALDLTGQHVRNIKPGNNEGYTMDLGGGTLWMRLMGCPGDLESFEYEWRNQSVPLVVKVSHGPIIYVSLKSADDKVHLTVRDASGRTLTKLLSPIPTNLVGGYFRNGTDLFFNFSDRQRHKWGGSFVLYLFDTPKGPHTSLEPIP